MGRVRQQRAESLGKAGGEGPPWARQWAIKAVGGAGLWGLATPALPERQGAYSRIWVKLPVER